MNKKIILFGKFIRFFSFLPFLKPSNSNVGVRVTYTHGVREKDLENFENLIRFIAKDHIFITPETFFEYLEKGNLSKGRYVLMTFDDGFLSSFHAVKKILNKYSIKAILFVPTAILDLKNEAEMLRFTVEKIYYKNVNVKHLETDDYLFMNGAHLRELSSEGHMICPHTHSHIFIKEIMNEIMVNEELNAPKIKLEKLLQTKINAFAFPVGTEKQVGIYAYKHINQIYKYCFTALSGINRVETDKFKLHRINLPPDAPQSYVEMAMNGVYDSYYKLKMYLLSKKI